MRKWMGIIVAFIFYLLVSCAPRSSSLVEESVVNLEISSPIQNQISRVESFEMSSIWIDVSFESGEKRQMTLAKDMLSSKDYAKLNKPGEHTITVNIGDKSIDISLYLYDETILNQAHIYCYDENEFIYKMADSVYELEIPILENEYFYNWYQDENRTIPYQDTSTQEVIRLYAKFSNEKTYRIRFFHQDILVYEEYVKEGENATPPMMLSFDSYYFVGWDNSFSDIHEDRDIHSIYVVPKSKMIWYDNEGNIIKEMSLTNGTEIVDPIAPKIDGYIFTGWRRDIQEQQSEVCVYPMYKKQSYEVRFYRDNFDTFLYSQWVDKDGSVSCNYEIENYSITGYSECLEKISSSLDVIVFYSPDEYSYYMDGELLFVLPFYEEPPSVKESSYVWKQTGENRFDLFSIKNEDKVIKLNTFEYGLDEMNLLNFIENPKIALGIQHDSYKFYEWYYDREYKNKVEDFGILFDTEILYGKEIKALEESELSNFSFEITVVEGQYGVKAIFNQTDSRNYVIVPSFYNNFPVISIDGTFFTIDYIFLSKYIVDISSNHLSTNKSIIIEDGNSTFYKKNECIYKKTNGQDILYICPRYLDEFVYHEGDKIDSYAFDQTTINHFYLSEGTISFSNIEIYGFKTIITLHIPKSLQELYTEAFWIKNIEIEESSLIRLNLSTLRYLEHSFELPKTVEFLDCTTDGRSDNLIISPDHPYFKMINSVIFDSTGEVLVHGLFFDEYVIPTEVKYLFLNCFSSLSTNKIVFHNNLQPCLSYNGFTSMQEQYNNFRYCEQLKEIVTPLDLDFPFLESLRDSPWYKYSDKDLLYFGSTLVLINNIKGELTLPEDIKKVAAEVIGRNV
ncbi:MAG: InlB B-repeat-containing protein, partial [Staphylococcus sp.]|nr:InlB B-repeat-containing protein [Staphylococcus sp.]